MTESKTFTWIKDPSIPRTYGFLISPKLTAKVKRKGIWSPDGSAEIGARKLRFVSNGKANMHMTIFDGDSEKELGKLDFYWKDFQHSTLKLTDGNTYTFRSHDIIRGVWSWLKQDTPDKQFIFRIDNPLQRSGTIENQSKDISALERDILLALGLHLQQYINNWMMTITLVVIAVVTGR